MRCMPFSMSSQPPRLPACREGLSPQAACTRRTRQRCEGGLLHVASWSSRRRCGGCQPRQTRSRPASPRRRGPGSAQTLHHKVRVLGKRAHVTAIELVCCGFCLEVVVVARAVPYRREPPASPLAQKDLSLPTSLTQKLGRGEGPTGLTMDAKMPSGFSCSKIQKHEDGAPRLAEQVEVCSRPRALRTTTNSSTKRAL